MAEFIDLEADGSDASDAEDFEMDADDPTLIDESEQENDLSFYRFHNQIRNSEEVLAEVAREEPIRAQSMKACNHNEHDDHQGEIDDFKLDKSNREEFLKTLISPVSKQTKENSFFLNLLYAINYFKLKEVEEFEESTLKSKIGEEFCDDLKFKEHLCVLNLSRRNFDEMCFDINQILIKNYLFLRVYELKDKYRYLFHQNEQGKKIIKSALSCIREKCNGFNIAAPSL